MHGKTERRKIGAIRLLVGVLISVNILAIAACRRGQSFHEDFPVYGPRLLLVGEDGAAVGGAKATVTTVYWYPTLLGTPDSKTFVDEFTADSSGNLVLAIRRHHQITKITVSITAEHYRDLSVRIDPDLDWSLFEENPRRIPLVPDHCAGPIAKDVWRGINAYESQEHRVVCETGEVGFSLSDGKFHLAESDLVFEVSRPVYDDPAKEDEPVGVRVRYPHGRLQRLSENEAVFALRSPLGRWGDTDVLEYGAKNSRNWPAIHGTFAFSSADGTIRGTMSVAIQPVADHGAAQATTVFAVWCRVDRYSESYPADVPLMQPAATESANAR